MSVLLGSESCFLQRQSFDETFLKDSVLERLKDDDPEVAAVTLRVLPVSEVNTLVSLIVVVCSLSPFFFFLDAAGHFGPGRGGVVFVVSAGQS